MSSDFKIKFLSHAQRLRGGASILTITTFGSYVLGLVRDRILAQTFGASRTLDIYNAAFHIPDLILNIFVAGALSAAFIPIFSGLLAKGQHSEADRFASTTLQAAGVTVIVVGLACFLLMPWLAPLIAPGFTPEEQAILIRASRMLLVSPLLFAFSNGIGGMLISYKRYLPYGLSPMLYNLGIIGGALFGAKYGVNGIIVGTLFGALLHLAVRLAGIARTAFRFRDGIDLADHHFIHMVKLMLPKMIGHPVEQVTFLLFTNIASLLAAGSITVVNFARNFQSVPVSLFGIAFSLAIFPMLCEAAAQKKSAHWRENFNKARRNILFFTLPSALGLLLLAKIPVALFLGGGNFTPADSEKTALVLAIFSLAIPTESLQHLYARGFYALKNTVIPVVVGIAGLLIAIFSARLLVPQLDILAIPLGFALGSFARLVLLVLLLPRMLRERGLS